MHMKMRFEKEINTIFLQLYCSLEELPPIFTYKHHSSKFRHIYRWWWLVRAFWQHFICLPLFFSLQTPCSYVKLHATQILSTNIRARCVWHSLCSQSILFIILDTWYIFNSVRSAFHKVENQTDSCRRKFSRFEYVHKSWFFAF